MALKFKVKVLLVIQYVFILHLKGANYLKNAEVNGREQDVILKDVALQALRERREHTIRMLKDAADTADEIYYSYAGREIKANTAALIGGVTAVIGGIATFATGGLGIPAVLTALLLKSGGWFSIVGGCWSLKNAYDRDKEFKILYKRLEAILREDEKEIQDMFEEILHRRSLRDGGVLEPVQLAREVVVLAMASGFDGIGNSSSQIKEMIKRISIVTNIISHGGFQILSGLAVVKIQNYICAIAKPIKKEVGKQLATCYNGAGQVTKRVIEELMALEITEKGWRVLMKRATFEEISGEVAGRATQLAIAGAETSAKTATAKVAGALTTLFGGITIAWEGYKFYQNYHATREESQLGKELRSLAYTLKRRLETGSIYFKISKQGQWSRVA